MSTQPDEPIPADLLPTLLAACREMQIELGFSGDKRVHRAVHPTTNNGVRHAHSHLEAPVHR